MEELVLERTAQRNPGPSGPGQASYLSICGQQLAAPYRSGESPSPRERVLQKLLIFVYHKILFNMRHYDFS